MAGIGQALQPHAAGLQGRSVSGAGGQHRHMQFDKDIAAVRESSCCELASLDPRLITAAFHAQPPQQSSRVGQTHQRQRVGQVRLDDVDHPRDRLVDAAQIDLTQRCVPVQVAEQHCRVGVLPDPGLGESQRFLRL